MKNEFWITLMLLILQSMYPTFAKEEKKESISYPQKLIQVCWIDNDNILISDGNYYPHEAKLVKTNAIRSITRILKYNVTNNSFEQLYNRDFEKNEYISFNCSSDTLAFFDNVSRVLTIKKNGRILLEKKILFNEIYDQDRFYDRNIIQFFLKWLAVYNDKAIINFEILKYEEGYFNMVFENMITCGELSELFKRKDIERIDDRVYDCRENNIFFCSIYTGNDQYERRIYGYSIPDNSLKLLIKDYPEDHPIKDQIRSNDGFIYIRTYHIGDPTKYPIPRVLIYDKINKIWMKPIDNVEKIDVSQNLLVCTRMIKNYKDGQEEVSGEVKVYNLKGEMILSKEIPITSKKTHTLFPVISPDERKVAVFKNYSEESPVIIDVDITE